MLNQLTAATLAGLAGAVSVNVLHESTRQLTPLAPRMDLVGMQAVAQIATALGTEPPARLRATTFAGDVIANTVYYGLVGVARRDRAFATGTFLGTAAGIGGVLLPRPLGLGDEEVNRARMTQALTVGLYLAGGLVSALVYHRLAPRSDSF